MSGNHELKRSLTDITVNSNVVSLENLNDVNESVFQKTTKKGKLFKGPNWTAYNKENLGSIPRNIEKSLVEDKKSITKIGFSTQSERFFPKNQNMKNNPGPGSYNLCGDMDFTRTSSSFYSSKGLGNGFVSTSDRFDDSKLYYCKYAPGPGEYCPESNKTLEHEVATSILGKSLYNNKKTQSLKIKRDTPGPGYYNPIVNTFDNKYKGKMVLDSVFKSKVNRFKKGKNSNFPGPGKYFKDEQYNDINDKNRAQSQSYFFRGPLPKKYNEEKKLNQYDIKTKQEKDDAKFRLIDKKGKVINYYQQNSDYEFLQTIKSGVTNPFAITKKDLFKLRNKTFMKDNPNSQKGSASLVVANGGLESEQGMEYIHKILSKPPKPNLFELYSPRWKKNELEFKVPGPAYYHPRIQQKVLSFNRNNVDFIWTPGVVNEDYEEPLYNE